MKGTLYSLFGNSELDKAEKRIADLAQEAEQQRYLSEKEKNEIRKEVVLLQDTVKGRDRAIAELKETVQIYEEERNWMQPLASVVKPKIPFLFHRCISVPTKLFRKKITQERSLSLANMYLCK